jgi:hypothetical protein
MTDVPTYVAIITAGAGIIGAAIPQVTTVIRDVRQAERDRRERSATATREACVALLRASGEVRTLAEGIRTYRGEPNGMRERVAAVRDRAEETQVHAAEVGMLAPARLAESADQVASAASDLARDVLAKTDLDKGIPIDDPDVAKLVDSIAAFRRAAVEHAAN